MLFRSQVRARTGSAPVARLCPRAHRLKPSAGPPFAQVLRSLFDTLDIHQQGSLNDLQFLALLKCVVCPPRSCSSPGRCFGLPWGPCRAVLLL